MDAQYVRGIWGAVRLPSYTYVPGHWPHPTRDPNGHSFGLSEGTPTPLDADAWQWSTAYLKGIELFDHGYYWEAHEVWEGLWIAAGRTGATGDLLNGLIKLAAAGVKLRQGLGSKASRLGALASERFDRAQGQCGTETLAGLAFTRLHALARQVRMRGPLGAPATEPVVIVFEGTLLGRASPSGEPTP